MHLDKEIKKKKTLTNPLDQNIFSMKHNEDTNHKKNSITSQEGNSQQSKKSSLRSFSGKKIDRKITIEEDHHYKNSVNNNKATSTKKIHHQKTKSLEAFSASNEINANDQKLKELSSFFKIASHEKILHLEEGVLQFTHNIEVGAPNLHYKGVIGFTEYRIFFYYYESSLNNESNRRKMKFPLLFIYKLNKLDDKINSNSQTLEMFLRDFRYFKITLTTLKKKNFYEDLVKLVFPYKTNTYAYKISKSVKISIDGWNIFNLKEEFVRQGIYDIPYSNKEETKQSIPHLSKFNDGYNISTYPKTLFVIDDFTDEDLLLLSNGFVNNRIPIITYLNSSRNSSLWISSHYKGTAVSSKYYGYLTSTIPSNNDLFERYLKKMTTIGSEESKLIIYDLKNKTKGGELNEIKNCYEEIQYCELDPISKTRSKFNKLFSLEKSVDQPKKYYSAIESCGWLENISQILRTVTKIANSMNVSLYYIKVLIYFL